MLITTRGGAHWRQARLLVLRSVPESLAYQPADRRKDLEPRRVEGSEEPSGAKDRGQVHGQGAGTRLSCVSIMQQTTLKATTEASLMRGHSYKLPLPIRCPACESTAPLWLGLSRESRVLSLVSAKGTQRRMSGVKVDRRR